MLYKVTNNLIKYCQTNKQISTTSKQQKSILANLFSKISVIYHWKNLNVEKAPDFRFSLWSDESSRKKRLISCILVMCGG